MTAFLLTMACLCAAGGAVSLRLAWGRMYRSVPLNATGWGLFALAAILAWPAAGAWGEAISASFGMGAALLLLAHAAAVTPAVPGAKASNRRVGMLPGKGEALNLARRFVTFCIVALLAMIVSIGVAIAAKSALALAGASEANAIVAAFFVMPLAWAILAFILLMQERRARQWRLLLLWAVPGIFALFGELAA